MDGMEAKGSCRSDPLPFQFLSSEASRCTNAMFVDIDYDKLMTHKTTIATQTREIRDVLGEHETSPEGLGVLLRAPHYLGIGCDLQDLKRLDETISKEIKSPKCPILCVAEVSLTYMDVNSADGVISWASSLGEGV
jgi:tRNA wybutosine-synthesizing protein 4